MPERSWIADAGDSYDRVVDRCADLVRSGLEDLPLEMGLVDHFARRVVEAGVGLVLDVGCGPGFLTRHLASRGLAVSGIDISTGMLRFARSHNRGSGFVAGSLTQMPVADSAAAGVFCWYVLHHVPDEDLRTAIRELARVTASGGSLMLGGHVGHSAYVKTEGYGGLPMRVLNAPRTPEIYTHLLREAGLVVEPPLPSVRTTRHPQPSGLPASLLDVRPGAAGHGRCADLPLLARALLGPATPGSRPQRLRHTEEPQPSGRRLGRVFARDVRGERLEPRAHRAHRGACDAALIVGGDCEQDHRKHD